MVGTQRTEPITPGASPPTNWPEVPVTSGITASASARGALFTVKPEVGPTPYRARATVYITLHFVLIARERRPYPTVRRVRSTLHVLYPT